MIKQTWERERRRRCLFVNLSCIFHTYENISTQTDVLPFPLLIISFLHTVRMHWLFKYSSFADCVSSVRHVRIFIAGTQLPSTIKVSSKRIMYSVPALVFTPSLVFTPIPLLNFFWGTIDYLQQQENFYKCTKCKKSCLSNFVQNYTSFELHCCSQKYFWCKVKPSWHGIPPYSKRFGTTECSGNFWKTISCQHGI
jgi:hypothetical protein